MSAGSDELSPVEMLAEEFLERQQRGEKPTIGDYCEKHPELAEEIREVFEALAMMEELKPDSHDATGTFGSGIQSDGKRLERVGDYRILREIGRGGMGVVYEAEQESLRRRVALKVLPRRVAGDEKALQRFQREARAAARMHHTNIVPVFDVGEDEDHVFYAMQMIQGQGLDLVVDDLKRLRTEHVVMRKVGPADRAVAQRELEQRQSIAASLVTGQFHQEDLAAEDRRGGTGSDPSRGSLAVDAPVRPGAYAETILDGSGSTASAVLPGQSQLSTAETNRSAYFRSVAEIGLQTGRALSYAHARGIIHRDIKPSNLLLDAAGVVWVTDFGLAKTSDEAMTHTGDILGTIRYMSPERFKGQCDVRADLYSLGLTLYELLVLRPAFASPDRLRLIELVSSTEPPAPRSLDPRIPRDLETIILKSIDKDPRRRYQSADELCEDLERFIQDEPIKARRVSLTERLVRWSRRNKGLAASLATVGALLLAINIAGPLVTWEMAALNDQLKQEKRISDERARQNEQLAAEREIEAANALAAKDEADNAREATARLQELTRRNLYAAEINMAQLAGLTGDFARREELLGHWRTTDETDDLRGYEWYQLLAEGQDGHLVVRTHADRVAVVSCSPDGARFASGGEDGEIHICDLSTGALLQKLTGHSGPVFAVGWSPDGARLASGGFDMTVRIWDVASGQEVLSMGDHNDWVFRLAWAPRSDRVATASLDGTARVWDAETGEQLALFRSNGQAVLNVAWHPDGAMLATVGFDPVVHVWDVSTGEEVEAFEGHVNAILGVDWHPDGKRLATAAPEGEFFVWRSGQPDPAQRIFGSSRGRADVRWSPDGRWLAVSDASNSIRIHDADTAQEITTFRGHSDLQTSLHWSPDSQHLASSGYDGTVRVWPVGDSSDTQQITTDSDAILAADWSPNGRLLATGDDSGRVRIWEADTREMVRELADPEGTLVRVMAVGFSPDGTLLAAGGRLQNEVLVWDAATGSLVHRLQGPPLQRIDQASGIRSLAWDPERDRLAAGNSHGEILLWQPRTGELLGTCRTNSAANGVCFVPHTDGRWLVSAHYNGRVRVWDLERGQTVQELDVGSRLFGLAVNSDGTLLAAADGFYATRNRTQFTGSGSARVWTIRRTGDGIELRDELLLPGPKNVVRSVEFSPDGTRLVGAGAEGTVYVWDVTGDVREDVRRQLLALDNGTSEIHVARFSPDGIRLAAAGLHGDVRIWDALPGYAGELSPVLLPGLERKMMSGAATRDDYLLRARILARQGDWTAAGATCEKLFELDGAAAWFASDLWVLDGPYPAKLDTAFAPEQMEGIDDFDVLKPLAGTGEEGYPESLQWRPRELHKSARIDFGAVLENRQDVSGYALLRVYSARDQTVGIIVGADDEHRLWLNGELIQENLVRNVARPQEHAVPARFRRGWNSVLAKVVNATGSHGLFLALSDDPRELAPIYARSGEHEVAEEMWNRAVASRPDDAFLALNRADFLWQQGRQSEAQDDLDRAVELSGINEQQVRLERAYVLMGWGRDADALADLDRALELSPGSPMLLIERGRTNVKLRRLEAAAADYQAAVAVNPTNHWRTFQLAALLLEAGDDEGYEQLRSDMLARWGDSTNATIAERTCKVCLLRPADDAMLDQLDALLDATRNAPPQHPYYAYYLACDGMLRYRQGESRLANDDEVGAARMFRAALRLLDSARARNLSDRVATHCDLFRAMTRYRLGLAEPALTALEQVGETMAGGDFTQPGQRFGDGWHDEFMPRATYCEAARLIQGPAWESLLEAERLLAGGDVEPALEALERAVSEASQADQMLQTALALLEEHRAGYEALVPTSQNANSVAWQYRFTTPPDGWNTPGNSDDSGWSTAAAPFGSYAGNFYPKSPWPQSEEDIWMRVRFDVAQRPVGPLRFRAYIDEDAEIFINGGPAASGVWVGSRYQELDVSPGVTLQPGTNVLAVHCSNVDQGTGVDVGLYVGNDLEMRQRLLTAALAASESPELLRQRAETHLRLNDLERAADDYFRAVELNSEASLDFVKAASLLVAVGDVDRYRQVCRDVLDRFAASNNVSNAEHVIKICSILPLQDDSIRAQSERIAVEQIGPNPEFVWAKMSALLSDYRREAYQAAIDRGRRCVAISREDEAGLGAYRNMSAFAWLTQAMSYHQLGDRENAEAALQKGLEACNGGLPEFPEIGWWDTFISRALLREADALVNGESSE